MRSAEKAFVILHTRKSDDPQAVQLPEELKKHSWERILTNRLETKPSLKREAWLPWECEVYTPVF